MFARRARALALFAMAAPAAAQSSLSAISKDLEDLVRKTTGSIVTVIASDQSSAGLSAFAGVWFHAANCESCVITGEEIAGDRFHVHSGEKTFIARARARGKGITVLEIVPVKTDGGSGERGPAGLALPCCGEFRRGRIVVGLGPSRVGLGILDRPDVGECGGEDPWVLSAETGSIDRSSVVVDDKGTWVGFAVQPREQRVATATRPSRGTREPSGTKQPLSANPRAQVVPAKQILAAAKEILEEQVKETPRGRPALGVMLQDVDPAVRSHLKLPSGRGVQVTRVAENGPARQAEIKVHDVILRGNGFEFTGLGSFLEWFDARKRGEEIELEVYQEGKSRKLKLKLE